MAKANVLASIKQLETGKEISFPMAKTPYVRSACSVASFSTGGRYSTRVSRDEGLVYVRRTE